MKDTVLSFHHQEGEGVRPIDLKCEYADNPFGLEVNKPRFGWVLQHPKRGQRQTAYQVLVSSTLRGITSDNGDLWDSGKVDTSRSVNILYSGTPLESGKTYYWKVRWWDGDGKVSPWSDVASLEMGLLKAEDWRGKWIQGGHLLRKEFTFGKEVARARAYISGLGYYELRINGCKVGDRALDPGWTSYEKRALYTAYDVTTYLMPSKNAVGIILGNGRYIKPWGYGPPKAILQLNIEFKDGTRMSVVTDDLWKASEGPMRSNDLYNGVSYDARLEKPGWDEPDYDDSDWRPCQAAEPPGGKLVSSGTSPPVRVVKIMQPIEILVPKPSVYVYDFGQNFTGWVRLRVKGPRGTEVKLRHSELLFNDGTLNTQVNRAAAATDTYILKGDGVEEFEPKFTYHGFRYVEVTGFPGTPTLESLEGRVVYSDVESVGGFECSNQLINNIHKNVRWGQLSNLMSIPTDCPQRDERQGWLGDAQLSAELAILNFWMPCFYEKYMADIKDSQEDDGALPDVVPPYWKLYPADPAWGTAYVVIPWLLYLYCSDIGVLEDHYDGIKKWVTFLGSEAKDHIVSFSKYGDWCPPAHVRPVETPPELMSTWIYYHDVLTLSKIANVLDKGADAQTFADLAGKIKEAFNKTFLIENHYKTGLADLPFFPSMSQTCNTLPLYLDMVPEDKVAAVFNSLVQDIEVMRDRHLNTGIVGTRYLLDTLTKYGRTDLAYDVATQTTYPSWGYMIKEGATTVWERWEKLTAGAMNSHNHIMFGAVDAWFYKVLGGINVDPTSSGFERFLVKPYIVGDLKYVSASMRTIRGTVSSIWTRSSNCLALNVTVPVNSEAEVFIPKVGLKNVIVKENGHDIWKDSKFLNNAEGITKGEEKEDWIIFFVGSGTYLFDLSGE